MTFLNFFDRKRVPDLDKDLLGMLAENPAVQAAVEAKEKKIAERRRELVAEKKSLLADFEKAYPRLEAEFAAATRELESAQTALKIAVEKYNAAQIELQNLSTQTDAAIGACNRELETTAEPLIGEVLSKLRLVEEALMNRTATPAGITAFLPGLDRLLGADAQTRSAKLEILRTHVRPGLKQLKLEAIEIKDLDRRIGEIFTPLLAE